MTDIANAIKLTWVANTETPEQATFTMHCQKKEPAATPAVLDEMYDFWVSVGSSPNPLIGAAELTELRMSSWNPALSRWVQFASRTVSAAANSVAWLPLQLAVVVTLKAPYPPLAVRQRFTNRAFLGPVATTAQAFGARVDATSRNQTLTALKLFHDELRLLGPAIIGDPGEGLQAVSEVGAHAFEIIEASIGDRFDTQRRRREGLSETRIVKDLS